MPKDTILVRRDGHIATVTLNRPGKLNAMTRPMWRRLGEVLDELAGDEDLRCVVLRGAGGKSFSPGNDISEFEMRADQLRSVVENALQSLEDHPDYYRKFDPPNGWGSYEGVLKFMREFRTALWAAPDDYVLKVY